MNIKQKIFLALFLIWFSVIGAFCQNDSLISILPDTTASGNNNNDTIIVTSPDTFTSDSLLNLVDKNDTSLSTDTLIDASLANNNPKFIDTVIVSFMKYKSEIREEGTFFNILTIKNYYSKEITGELKIHTPIDWKLIPEELERKYTIAPNDSLIIPVRVTVSKAITGGIAYPTIARFIVEKNKYSGSFYLLRQSVSSFNLSINESMIYLNSVLGTGEFKVKVKNTGNVDELVKLDFKLGKLIRINTLEPDSDYIYLELKPDQDTTLFYRVSYMKPKATKKYLEGRMAETSIRIKASTDQMTSSKSIWCRYIPYKFNNKQNASFTPLNIGIYLNNLLSNSPSTMKIEALGSILINEHNDGSYYVTLFNIQPFTATYTFDSFMRRNLFFNIKYRYKNTMLSIGDRLQNQALPIQGRGISVTQRFLGQEITGTAMMHRYYNIWGGGLLYQGNIWKIPRFTAGFGYMNDLDQSRTQMRYLFSSSLPLKFINLSYGFNFNQINYSSGIQYNRLGFNIGANISREKFHAGAYFNRNFNFAYYTATSTSINVFSKYNFKSYSSLNFNVRGNDSEFGNSTPNLPSNTVRNLNSTLIYMGRFNPKNSFNVGPEYQYNYRDYTGGLTRLTETYQGHTISMRFFLNKRLSNEQSVVAYYKPGVAFLNYNIEHLDTGYVYSAASDPQFVYNLGASYNKTDFFRININYFYGPYFFFDQIQALKYNNFSKNLRITPVIYRNYELDDFKIRTSLMGNFNVTMPNQAEQMSLSFMSEAFLAKGWTFNLNANFYFSNRVNGDNEKFTYKNYNLNFGVRKSFDVQQIREKYYDFTAICFKDINGNGTKDENEPMLSNVLIKLERVVDATGNNFGSFVQQDLLTNYDGKIEYINIPQSKYIMTLMPLVNLGELYPLNGLEQELNIMYDETYYIPFVETYKVKGEIVLIRDEFSSLGIVEPGQIKVTATSIDGREYHDLSDNNGSFVLSIPMAGIYTVKVNNIFGDNFEIENDEYQLDFNGMKAFEIDFVFKEKKRKINFTGGMLEELSYMEDEENNIEKINSDVTPVDLTKLSDKELDWLKNYIDESVQNTIINNNYNGKSGLTPEDIELIEKMIRDIHFADFKNKENITELPSPIRAEVDEIVYTRVVDNYKNRLASLEDQIAAKERELANAKTDIDRQRIQKELDELKAQKSQLESKYENASDRLQDVRENLDIEKAKQQNETKSDNPNRGKKAEFTTNKPNAYTANGIPMDEQLPNGLIYRIQLGVYSKPVKADNFKGLHPIAGTTITSNKYSYATGIFYTYEQAMQAKEDIQSLGIQDAFIIAFKDGEHISVAKAMRLE